MNPIDADDFEKEMLKLGDPTKALDYMLKIFKDNKYAIATEEFNRERMDAFYKDFLTEVTSWRTMYGDQRAFELVMINFRVKEMIWKK